MAQSCEPSRGYFPGPEPLLEAELTAYLEWLGAEARRLPGFCALLLAGGYGRGEGGIFRPSTDAPPKLYNDLEFYLFGENAGGAAIDRWVHEGERRLGIEVEFKVMSPGAFSRSRPSMFYYDLLAKHVLVAGDEAWVAALPGDLRSPEAVPMEEAGRLLVNRGMSLLRCARWAEGEIHLPEGFCDRIAAKLKLALGDAVLCASGKYHWSCLERGARLSAMDDAPPGLGQIAAWHSEGVSFKLHPVHADDSPADWRKPLGQLRDAWLATFLWVESRRLGARFESARSYAGYRGRLFPGERRLGNVLRQLRDLRRSPRLPFRPGDHPRAAIWKSLALLMGGSAPDAALAAGLLGATALRGAALEERCRSCWKHYP